MSRGIFKFRTSKSARKKLSLILCVSLIINMLFGSMAMAAAATGGHHSHSHHSENVHTPQHHQEHRYQEQHPREQHHGKLHHNALHKIDLPENNHNAGDKPHSGHSHDCCKMTDGCTNMAACAAHCAQPLPALWQQPHSVFCLSFRLDVIAPGSLASIDPSRQFKPPRF